MSKEKLNQAVIEALHETLPEFQVTWLKEELDKSKKAQEELKSTKLMLESEQASVKHLDKECEKLKSENLVFEKREMETMTKEAELNKREIRFELEVAKIKQEEAEKRAVGIQDLTSIVFKNPTMTYDNNWTRSYTDRNGNFQNESFNNSTIVNENKD